MVLQACRRHVMPDINFFLSVPLIFRSHEALMLFQIYYIHFECAERLSMYIQNVAGATVLHFHYSYIKGGRAALQK
jgi:hypothetical protein